MNGGQTISVGGYFRKAKYSENVGWDHYLDVYNEGVYDFPAQYQTVSRQSFLSILGFGLYYENKDQTVYGGLSLDNSPSNTKYVFDNELSRSKDNPYYGNLWSFRANYGMRISLGKLLTLQPDVGLIVFDANNARFNLGAKLYFKDRFFVGGVYHFENGYSVLVGLKYKKFELSVSVGKTQ